MTLARAFNRSGPQVWYTPGWKRTPHGFCYVAGPMTGIPGFNYPAFAAARDALALEGWDVVSPADMDVKNLGIDFGTMTGTEDLSHLTTAFARQDMAALLLVDAVFLLPGWSESRGAMNEANIASMLGVPCYIFATREPVDIKARFCQ